MKALVVFTCVALLAGMGYLVHRASRPTVEDAIRESASATYSERVAEASMKSDLRNVVVVQEMYFASTGGFADDLPSIGFAPSPGVYVTVIRAGTDGFTAHATYPGSELNCVLYVGPESLYGLPPARHEAEPSCE